MSGRARLLAAVAVMLAVLVVGAAWSAQRSVTWESRGSLYLTPAAEDAFISSALLDAFERSGTIGTYVELLSSPTLRARAGASDVEIRTRAIPESRVIELTATGEAERVEDALQSLLRAAVRPSARLDDGWVLRVAEPPTAPVQLGPSTGMVLAAVVLLALLAGLVTLVALARLAPPSSGSGGPPGVVEAPARDIAPNGFARAGR